MSWKNSTKRGEFYNASLGVPYPRIQEASVQVIKERYFRGEYPTEVSTDIVALLQGVEELSAFRTKALEVTAKGDKRIEALTKDLDQLREAFPGPECEICSCEMSLENHGGNDFYVCDCHGEGCSCFLSPPCTWCMNIMDADVWIFEHSSEYRSEKRAEKNQAKHIAREDGPSAVAAAKPVTPKLVMSIQSGDWDGLENL